MTFGVPLEAICYPIKNGLYSKWTKGHHTWLIGWSRRDMWQFSSFCSHQFRLVGHVVAGVAVGVHEELGEGVDGDEGLEVPVGVDEVHHVLHLNLRMGRRSVVGIGAGFVAGARAWTTRT